MFWKKIVWFFPVKLLIRVTAPWEQKGDGGGDGEKRDPKQYNETGWSCFCSHHSIRFSQFTLRIFCIEAGQRWGNATELWLANGYKFHYLTNLSAPFLPLSLLPSLSLSSFLSSLLPSFLHYSGCVKSEHWKNTYTVLFCVSTDPLVQSVRKAGCWGPRRRTRSLAGWICWANRKSIFPARVTKDYVMFVWNVFLCILDTIMFFQGLLTAQVMRKCWVSVRNTSSGPLYKAFWVWFRVGND